MSFTVSQILLAAGPNPALISSETAAYLVLSLAEQSLTRPRRVCADHALLHPGGAITIGDVPECNADDNGALLRELLGLLLACASQTPISDTLTAVVDSRASGPAALRQELQTALVPLNRGAARRALNRLYRKLGRVATVAHPTPRLELRDNACLKEPEAAWALESDEIVICVDEEELQEVQLPTLEGKTAETANRASHEPPSHQWHPAQPTPRLFHERAVPCEGGTPILGSLEVELRDFPSPGDHPPDAVVDMSHEEEQVSHFAEQPQADLASEWGDTIVDAPVSTVADHPTPRAVARRTVRRSAVSRLVERMPVGGKIDEARSSLLRMVNATADAHDFSLPGTVTPPPVAQDTARVPSSAPRRGPRRIALSAFVAVVTAASAWLLVPEGALTSHPMASSHVPHVRPVACRVNVHVEVPSEAKVYLNDSRERPLQRGPLAQFEGVECDSHAEVTVQMPNPSGSPLPEAWMRMPLPGVELRAAADRGVPFRVAPLGDAK